MAKIDLQKAPETTPARPRDIFSAMRTEMDRMFEHGLPRFPQLFRPDQRAAMVPELDVRENADTIMIDAELPGVEEKDISVTFANGVLTIRGEKKQEKEEKGENYYLAERSYGAFERALQLPDTVDDNKIEAKVDKGVLRITAAKKPEAVKAQRKIEIKKAP